MDLQFTAVFRKVPEGYIGFVEELPGANTQGATLEEARANLHEAVEMVLQANRELIEETTLGSDVIREAFKVGAGNGVLWSDICKITDAKTSAVPRHTEINDDLARKICKDLGVPPP